MGRRRRNSGIAEFFEGFNQGYSTVGRVLQDKELRDIAKAEEVDKSAFTEDQGAQLEEAAANGAAVTYDEGNKSYVITPADGGEAQTVSMAQRGVSFLGKDYDQPLTDSQKDRARLQAMSGVVSKTDPIKGMQLRQQAAQADLLDKQVSAATRDEEFQKGWGDVWKNSAVARAQSEQRDPTLGEQMATAASMMEYKAKHGKLDPSELMSYSEKMANLNNENYSSAMRVLHAGGSPEAIAAEFNKSGKQQVDPSQIAIRPITIKVNGKDVQTHEATVMRDGKATVINGFRELDGLGKADGFFQRQLQANADTRGEKSLNIQGAQAAMAREQFNAGAPARDNATQVAILQSDLSKLAPGDPQRAVIQQKITDLSGGSGADANAPSEVKLASALVKAGVASSMSDGLKMAMQSKDLSPDKMRFEIYKSALTQTMGDPVKAKEITDEAMNQFGAGSKAAPAPTERPVGMERVIESGPNKGKTAVWDGKGWKLKG